MKRPETSKNFSCHRDLSTGVESWILTGHVAPYQQAFYFVNDSFSGNGRYLWFYCGFLPSKALCLGVLDFESDEMTVFPSTQFLDASPAVHPVTGEAYFFSRTELWKIAPHPDAEPEYINRLPDEIVKGRNPIRSATHITFSPKGDSICIDPGFGRECFLGEMPLDGSECKIWQHLDFYANHAQFSPVDPDLILFCQDGCRDIVTGEQVDTRKRIWTIRRGGQAKPIFPDIDTPMHGHEWWSADGRYIWFIHYGQGTFKYDIATGELLRERPTNLPVSHSYSSSDDRYLATDICCHEYDYMQMLFTDLQADKEIFIVSAMPKIPYVLRNFHCHPHPHFSVGDRYITYTTTVRGRVDVAVTSVSHILELLNQQ